MTVCFILLVTGLAAFSLLYIASSGKLVLARLFDMPVLLTLLLLVNFGLAGLEALLAPERLDNNLRLGPNLLVTALLFVFVGMIGFWAGCKAMEPRRKLGRAIIRQENDGGRVLGVALFLYLVGFTSKVYLLQAHLFSYTASLDLYRENLANAQMFMFGSQFATVALLMLCIERFFRPSSRLVRWLFWGVFSSECFWGLISGMKSVLLINFAAVALISTILTGKLAKKWVGAALAGLVVIYPLSDSYRQVLRGETAVEVTDFGAAARALSLAAAGGMQSTRGSSDWLQSGSDSTLTRIDLLPYFSFVLHLGNEASDLHGDERLWMIPYYPFVPRTIWPSKPVLEEGARFSEILGWGNTTSTPLTYPADCYIYAGIPGVVGGMFLLGLFAQRWTNALNGVISKYQVLKYAVLLLTCVRIEGGVMDLWVGILKIIPVLFAIGWVAYGRSVRMSQGTVLRPAASTPL